MGGDGIRQREALITLVGGHDERDGAVNLTGRRVVAAGEIGDAGRGSTPCAGVGMGWLRRVDLNEAEEPFDEL